jgi:hypothetical protein
MATQYGQPRRLNSVTVVLGLLVLAAGYWIWRFFPVYFDAWTVDHVLKELASTMYRANRLNEPLRTKTMRELLDKARADIGKQTSITDPDLSIDLEIEGNSATVTAEYDTVVTHPGITRTTAMHFKRVETQNIKAVNWE